MTTDTPPDNVQTASLRSPSDDHQAQIPPHHPLVVSMSNKPDAPPGDSTGDIPPKGDSVRRAGLSSLPPCFRCKKQPCRCKDGCTLYHADCRDVLPLLEPGSVDVVLTDPPYGIVAQFGENEGQGGKRKLQFDWDTRGIVDDVRRGLTMAFQMCKPKASCFVWVGFDSAERYAEPARRAGFTVKPAAWVKECHPPAGKGNWWPSGFELAYYGYRSGAWFDDTNCHRCNVWTADSYRYGKPNKNGHPTQKPLGMIRQHVAAIVPPGGLVLDPFVGSGTTLRAAKDLGRKAIGVEICEEYCEIAVHRLAQGVLPFGDNR